MITSIPTQLPPLSPSKAGGNPSVSQAVKEPAVSQTAPAASGNDQSNELNDDQKAEVARLQKVDQEVKAHESAHQNAGGQYAGSASFFYTVGPDGKRYAIGGEVSIDVAPIKDDPEATLAKLDVVIAAALAPAKPSAQDRKVAAAAVAARNQARAEFTEKRAAEQNEDKPPFDINNFGDTPPVSANKAYEIGNDLGQEGSEAGITISVTS